MKELLRRLFTFSLMLGLSAMLVSCVAFRPSYNPPDEEGGFFEEEPSPTPGEETNPFPTPTPSPQPTPWQPPPPPKPSPRPSIPPGAHKTTATSSSSAGLFQSASDSPSSASAKISVVYKPSADRTILMGLAGSYPAILRGDLREAILNSRTRHAPISFVSIDVNEAEVSVRGLSRGQILSDLRAFRDLCRSYGISFGLTGGLAGKGRE